MSRAAREGLHLVATVNAAWNFRNFRLPLLRALLADGHRVTVLAPGDDAMAVLQEIGCRVVPLRMDVKGLAPHRDVALVARLHTHFRRERPDAVLSFTIKNNIYGALAARLSGIPFVPNVTGLGTAFLSSGALRRVAEVLYRLAFARVPIVFFQNPDDRALFLERGLVRRGQARLVPGSGIDLGHFAPAPLPCMGPAADPGAPVFLMITRLLRDKGVCEFVDASRMLRRAFPAARCILLGPAGAENRTAIPLGTILAWQAEGIVEYAGSTDDVRPHIAAADCVVLPSYREGTARTLLEAAAMARPLIATDVAGCRNVVEHEATGHLVRVRDSEDLARAMLRFAASRCEDRAAMGRRGRRKMEAEFDQALVASAYRQALAELFPGCLD